MFVFLDPVPELSAASFLPSPLRDWLFRSFPPALCSRPLVFVGPPVFWSARRWQVPCHLSPCRALPLRHSWRSLGAWRSGPVLPWVRSGCFAFSGLAMWVLRRSPLRPSCGGLALPAAPPLPGSPPCVRLALAALGLRLGLRTFPFVVGSFFPCLLLCLFHSLSPPRCLPSRCLLPGLTRPLRFPPPLSWVSVSWSLSYGPFPRPALTSLRSPVPHCPLSWSSAGRSSFTPCRPSSLRSLLRVFSPYCPPPPRRHGLFAAPRTPLPLLRDFCSRSSLRSRPLCPASLPTAFLLSLLLLAFLFFLSSLSFFFFTTLPCFLSFHSHLWPMPVTLAYGLSLLLRWFCYRRTPTRPLLPINGSF